MIVGGQGGLVVKQFHQTTITPGSREMRGIGVGVIGLGDTVVGRANPAFIRIDLQGHFLRGNPSQPIVLGTNI